MARAVAYAVLVAAVVLAGTGCAQQRADDPDRALTKREYIERANELQGEAAAVFAELDGTLAATPAAATKHVAAFDQLIAGYEGMRPPRDWQDEHDQLLEALRTMRHATTIVSRASARNRALITAQVASFEAAQLDYQRAVQAINAKR